jgi:hypothetical protein
MDRSWPIPAITHRPRMNHMAHIITAPAIMAKIRAKTAAIAPFQSNPHPAIPLPASLRLSPWKSFRVRYTGFCSA